MEFNSLPSDLILYETLIKLDPLELLSYCQVDKQANRYCNDPTFRQTYNNTLSNDEYQSLILDEAYNNDDKAFLTLIDKFQYFDKVVDVGTVHRAFLYFGEHENINMVNKINGFTQLMVTPSFLTFPPANTIISSITQFKNFLSSFSELEKTGWYTLGFRIEEWDSNTGVNLTECFGDIGYSGDLIVGNLSPSQIELILKVMARSMGVTIGYRWDKPIDVFSSISDALVRTKDEQLFMDLSSIALASKNSIDSIVSYGDLHQFSNWRFLYGTTFDTVKELFDQKRVMFDVETMHPHNKGLYLYILDRYLTEEDKIDYLGFGFWALNPDEWMKIVSSLNLDKDSKRELCGYAASHAGQEGFTFWKETIWFERLKIK